MADNEMNRNGLMSMPPHQPGFFRKLLGKLPKENAIIEARNLFAENEIASVSMVQIADILKRYDLGFSEVREEFGGIFRTVLLHLAEDRELSTDDQAKLAHLQMALELRDEDATRLREDALAELYGKSLADALSDGHLSPEERKRLDAISDSFKLPEGRVTEIYKTQVVKLIQLAFDQAIADRRVTGTEEARLRAMAENLGVTLSNDGESQRVFDRFRLLGRIDEGDLPSLSPPIVLQRGEICHAALTGCTQSEIRTQTKSYRYSGPSGSIKIVKGLRWRYGSVSVQRVTRDVMTTLDSGTLYLTNKRLLFDGSKKNAQIVLKKITKFTVFSDGLKIEKDTGRDQYFVGDGDPEVCGSILEHLLGGG